MTRLQRRGHWQRYDDGVRSESILQIADLLLLCSNRIAELDLWHNKRLDMPPLD